MIWDKDEIDLLTLWVEQGWLYRDIANELGRTYPAIKQKAKSLNLVAKNKCNSYSNEEYDIALDAVNPTTKRVGNYVNGKIKIEHVCTICTQVHLAAPGHKLEGFGHCGGLQGHGVPRDKPALAYLIYFEKFNLYKIGITSKSIKTRLRNISKEKCEVILLRHFALGADAMSKEKEWLENIRPYKLNTGLLNSGNTETFRID